MINLTKMSGAGCLAHEWGHALDHAIGSSFGVVGFASEAKPQQFRGLPESFKAVINALRYKTILVKPEDNKESVSPQLAHAKKNLTNWIASVKPSKMTPELSSAWENTVQRIFDNADSFTGSEYWRPNRRYDIKTHPDVESLSQISKFATNHVIPRESKMQICLWAKEVNRFGKQMEASEPVKKQVRTDYYQGSIDFGNLFSKYGHGYWDSICEMFARAFDCYISDKVAEQGYHSDYLSARANSFVAPNPKGA